MSETATPAANSLESSMTLANPVNFGEPPSEEDENATPETGESEAAGEAIQPEGQPPTEAAEETPAPEVAATEEKLKVLSYDRLLPLEQFQHEEEVPEELLQAAARKWKIPLDALEQQDWIQPFLRDKINTDIAMKSQRYLEALAEEGEPETPKTPETPPEAVRPASLEETLKQLSPIAQKMVTPEGAKAFTQDVGKAWDDYREAVEGGDAKAISAAEQKVTEAHMRWMLLAAQNVVQSTLPQFVPNYIRSLAESHAKAEQAWSKAITMLGEDPSFSDVVELAKDGKLDEVFDDFPELASRDFKDASGKPLPPVQNMMERLRRAVRYVRGDKYKPATEVVAAGIRAGQSLEKKREQVKALGRLGSGRPTGSLSKPGSGKSFVDELVEANKREHPMEGI